MMISAMINPTITASRTMIITKSCVGLREVDVVFFTESAAPMLACTFRTVKDEEIDVAAKKTAAKNKVLIFTLCEPITFLTLHR